MTTLIYENDENETPLDDDEYEYAGDDDDDDMNHIRSKMFDDDDSDGEEQIIQNNNGEQNKSQASYNDEMNLIDYVIEEENEIGGNKGEDSNSTSRSTTYSRFWFFENKFFEYKIEFFYNSLISNNDENDDEILTSNQIITNKKQKIHAKEEGQMIRARAFLNRLDKKVQEKDDVVKQIR